ncbi:unnamed protein product [Ambrosiozyma monospora]|uniref:Peptide hydrolase n=1 Tax=Ambrosiozyma monospora TaxID=43982 RepID=A0A9W6Z7Q2_AMBMO|nr:unnamed protein product [Ambrosiozyma monospora]
MKFRDHNYQQLPAKQEQIDAVDYPVTVSPSRKRPNVKILSRLVIITLGLTVLITTFSKLSSRLLGSPELTEDELVSHYLNTLQTNLAANWSYAYSRDNQLAGTNLKMVKWAQSQYQSFGLDSEIDEYTALVSYPIDQSISLLGTNITRNGSYSKVIYKPSLKEDIIKEDPTSKLQVPAFLGYAKSGNVTAQFIYANYGTKKDFEKLVELGVPLKGKIAIIRYGAIFRGLKIKFAQDHGIAAVLLYSDPYDDGEIVPQNGYKTYPNGFARNPSAIQRGSAQFLSFGPGDPSTPGYAIKPGEEEKHGINRTDPSFSIPSIPALPISYREVTPILKTLNGYGAQIPEWQDNHGLIENFDYSVGPNPNFTLNLYNKQDFNVTTMYNILTKVEGHNKDDVIIIGNHHDSWVPAAGDPHSGSAVVMELGRALGELVKLGWKPKRSIWLASWDGEEYGLIGSTEFGEYHADFLQKKVVAYLNLDVATIGGNLKMNASPLLYSLLRDVADKLELYSVFRSFRNSES